MTKAVPPEFEIVPLAVWLLPTGTVPKAKLAGLVVNQPGPTTTAESFKASDGLGASLAINIVPLVSSTEVGANRMESVACSPGASVTGKLGLRILKPVPSTLACVMLMG